MKTVRILTLALGPELYQPNHTTFLHSRGPNSKKNWMKFEKTADLCNCTLDTLVPLHPLPYYKPRPFVGSGPCLRIKTRKYHFSTISRASNVKNSTGIRKTLCLMHTRRTALHALVPSVGPEPSPWIISTQEYHFVSHLKGFKCKKMKKIQKTLSCTHTACTTHRRPCPHASLKAIIWIFSKIKNIRFKNASNQGIPLMTSSSINGF